MFKKLCLILIVSTVPPIWAQVSPVVLGGEAMRTPPPVSIEDYSTAIGLEERRNYLQGGISLGAAYDDNLLAGVGSEPVSDESYTIQPMVQLDQSNARMHQTYTYRPGFTFYQHTSARNESDHDLSGDFQYRLTPFVTVTANDTFRKSSNVFNGDIPGAGGVSGSGQTPVIPVVAPVANQLSNTAGAEITDQFGLNSMVGVSAVFANLHYGNSNQVLGLSNARSQGIAGFYNHRLAEDKYFGATYQYTRYVATISAVPNAQLADSSTTSTNSLQFFFTMYLRPNLSFSLSGGPQHYEVSQLAVPSAGSWSPSATASVGWQKARFGLAAGYSRTVTGGGGLVGAYNANSGNLALRYAFARSWSAGASGNYVITKNVNAITAVDNPGGHTISATASVQHMFGEHLNLECGYTRLHQSYSNIAVVASNPDVNREYVSVSYQFSRPIGR